MHGRRFRLCGALVLVVALILGSVGPVAGQELKAYTEKLPKSLSKFPMVPIPAGKVTLDDPANPGKQLTVEVKPFYISKTEVRWDEFGCWVYRLDLSDEQAAAGFDAENRPSMPYIPPDCGFGTDGFAAISLSYLNATKYCEWLSKSTGKKYRLATEAEWVWACLGGKADTKLSAADLEKVAWFGKTMKNPTKPTEEPGPMPVEGKEANGYGLFDMLGNVREWCVGLDGKPVAKGGGWADDAEHCQPLARAYYAPDWQKTDPQNPKSKWWLSDAPWAGFRVVCEP